MAQEYIITMTAANRVGILSAVTKAMADLGGDLREASQTVVRGFFTMIFSAEFPDAIAPNVITDHLQDAGRAFGIEVSLKARTDDVADQSVDPAARLYILRLGGDNQPGVLRTLSGVIALKRIDIVGMHAIRTRAGAGFEMVMKIAVPPDFRVDGLLTDLNRIGTPFNMTADITDYTG
ncbi:MAG: ACT domain-containing protein [Planctomycetaceae bacterium]|nr:ACT domain-containing protein [Planctomycetaceae bacterium]